MDCRCAAAPRQPVNTGYAYMRKMMIWYLLAGVIIALTTIALLKFRRKDIDGSVNFPYKRIKTLFTQAERSFLGVLNQAVGESAHIFGKVRVADVVSPQKRLSRGDWQRAFNKISGKHFDFLVCNKGDLSVVCAIELDDRSHQSKNRQGRDAFLEGVCSAANVPLIRVPAKAAYTLGSINELVAPYFDKHSPMLEEQHQSPNESIEVLKNCPKCSSPMVKRIAQKGPNSGKEFLACSAFPKCRYTEPSA